MVLINVIDLLTFKRLISSKKSVREGEQEREAVNATTIRRKQGCLICILYVLEEQKTPITQSHKISAVQKCLPKHILKLQS